MTKKGKFIYDISHKFQIPTKKLALWLMFEMKKELNNVFDESDDHHKQLVSTSRMINLMHHLNPLLFMDDKEMEDILPKFRQNEMALMTTFINNDMEHFNIAMTATKISISSFLEYVSEMIGEDKNE